VRLGRGVADSGPSPKVSFDVSCVETWGSAARGFRA
jgi:hypothetical protein